MLHTPLYMQGQSYPSKLERLLLAALGDGATGAGDFAVAPRAGGANMSVDVAAGLAFVPSTAGTYVVVSDATENRTVASAPSPGNSRIDLVIARVYDPAETGTGTDFEFKVEVITGTPSATPAAPATPARSIALARLTLTSSTTTITSGVIGNVRARSASVSDRTWPIVASATLADAEEVGNVAETWGSVTIGAPNRRVEIVATVTGTFAGDGGDPAVAELALRATRPNGDLYNDIDTDPATSTGVLGHSASGLHPVPIGRAWSTVIDPEVGENVVVPARIIATAGTANFFRGLLVVEVFPA